MCAACGVLSGMPDWLDRVGNEAGIGANADETRIRERARLVKMVNALLAPCRAKVSDFGEQLILSSPTGMTKVVDNLAHVWMTADQIGLRAVDPLDESYLNLLKDICYG